MKLNIGCGKVYKKGYVNLDVHEGTVADRIMPAHHLDIDDSTVELIECHHVLEHVNAAEATFAISEFYRVLRPSGVLTIKTPDIETSFKRFGRFSQEERKYLMNWIYGIDMPGMGHKYGYPVDLLRTLLKDAGFDNIVIRRQHSTSVQPELYARCVKRESRRINEFNAQLLRKLVGMNVADPSNQVQALEVYSVVEAIRSDLESFLEGDQSKHLSKITVKVAAHSPSIGLALIETALDKNLGKEEALLRLTERLKNLMKIRMSRILVQMMKEHPISGSTQRIAFDSVLRLGMKSISKVFSEESEAQTLHTLRETSAKADVPQHVDLFTEGMLKTLSEDSSAYASKEFALGNLNPAYGLYMESLMFDRSNLIARRNLSRVLFLLGRVDEALEHLKELESLSGVFPRAYQKQVMAAIRKEREAFTLGRNDLISTPVYSIFAA